ncbi:ABC transporter permease [Paenibacillus donghaensis]|uniref:Lantibiotic ABC transporter permease n=1 Tax=Paenibacillus donghaensis TaxID=414771 RepID=A0A2Z2KH43_9BACL|nr:ABC transporter permease [Paenibacillus donghaensis]ASA22553.1 hypothetical protein B9T62_18250 [Paenibacillus donghaensis]
MNSGLWSAEYLKLKRTATQAVVLTVPVLAVLFIVAFGLLSNGFRVSPISESVPGLWAKYVFSIHWILIFAIPLGATVSASIMAGLEHREHSWKQTLAMPYSKASVWLVKFALLAVTHVLAGVVLGGALLASGLLLGIEEAVPWRLLAAESFGPYLAVFPILVLQLWISVTVSNQAVALSVGTVGAMAGLFLGMGGSGGWLPWTYVVNASPVIWDAVSNGPLPNRDFRDLLVRSVLAGLAGLILAVTHFSHKEFK